MCSPGVCLSESGHHRHLVNCDELWQYCICYKRFNGKGISFHGDRVGPAVRVSKHSSSQKCSLRVPKHLAGTKNLDRVTLVFLLGLRHLVCSNAVSCICPSPAPLTHLVPNTVTTITMLGKSSIFCCQPLL